MSSPSLFLVPLRLSIFLLFLPLCTSISFRMSSFDPNSTAMYFHGDAQVFNGAIQMNRYEYLARVGRAAYFRHIPIWDSATQKLTDFRTRFSFSIDTLGAINYGHGLVFYLAPVNFETPENSNGGFMGMFNTTTLGTPSQNQIVAVEFDSYVNNEWDPPVPHVGICVNTLGSAAYVPWNASLHSEVRANAWVDYSSKNKRLSVFLTYNENPIFDGKYYNFSYGVDLRKILPEWVTIGFSAATGMYVESNKVYSWEFNSTLEMKERDVTAVGGKKKGEVNKWMVGFATSWGAVFACGLIIAGYKVALGLASALLYLHDEWEQCVIHRDIKSSNVMLDSGFNAKLGDFGLARLMDHEVGPRTTGLAGTWGYLAPEYINEGKASKESDVYSFGVVALEIACGRKPVETRDDESTVRLVEWVWELHGNDRLMEAVDRKLGTDFDLRQMERLMVVGLWCAHPDHSLRPFIKQAIQVLSFEAAVPQLPQTMPIPVYRAAQTTSESQSSHGSITYTSLPVGR
ncbi:hypothetical protein H6P81_020275 [Aristolochia fimbriata]|uniref:non-specific serine/threonine protein kinase n=1 Tax=Aristolochia fimbriata TaxID=158543 RepID=A0AAV7DVV6_ARIFI|nr:hypothetical protein H6P81_020275 [Aristolochia fimbriata]